MHVYMRWVLEWMNGWIINASMKNYGDIWMDMSLDGHTRVGIREYVL